MPWGERCRITQNALTPFVFWAVANHLGDCASCRNYTRNVHVISQKVDSPLAHQSKKRRGSKPSDRETRQQLTTLDEWRGDGGGSVGSGSGLSIKPTVTNGTCLCQLMTQTVSGRHFFFSPFLCRLSVRPSLPSCPFTDGWHTGRTTYTQDARLDSVCVSSDGWIYPKNIPRGRPFHLFLLTALFFVHDTHLFWLVHENNVSPFFSREIWLFLLPSIPESEKK